MNSRIVYEATQRREHASKSNEQNDPSLLGFGELGIFGIMPCFFAVALKPRPVMHATCHDAPRKAVEVADVNRSGK